MYEAQTCTYPAGAVGSFSASNVVAMVSLRLAARVNALRLRSRATVFFFLTRATVFAPVLHARLVEYKAAIAERGRRALRGLSDAVC